MVSCTAAASSAALTLANVSAFVTLVLFGMCCDTCHACTRLLYISVQNSIYYYYNFHKTFLNELRRRSLDCALWPVYTVGSKKVQHMHAVDV